MSGDFHFQPEGYEALIRAEVPRFDELQRAAVDAIPFAPERVLELGIGTGLTTRALLERYPGARVTGLDSEPAMVFAARELDVEEVKLARMQDPLPDGPWDLVIAVLSVHHLDSGQKRDLFRRVREQSRSLVVGDVVEVPPHARRTPIETGWDHPDPAEEIARWCDGQIRWQADDLAVISARY